MLQVRRCAWGLIKQQKSKCVSFSRAMQLKVLESEQWLRAVVSQHSSHGERLAVARLLRALSLMGRLR